MVIGEHGVLFKFYIFGVALRGSNLVESYVSVLLLASISVL